MGLTIEELDEIARRTALGPSLREAEELLPGLEALAAIATRLPTLVGPEAPAGSDLPGDGELPEDGDLPEEGTDRAGRGEAEDRPMDLNLHPSTPGPGSPQAPAAPPWLSRNAPIFRRGLVLTPPLARQLRALDAAAGGESRQGRAPTPEPAPPPPCPPPPRQEPS